MGGKILEYEAKTILNKGRKEGIEIGISGMVSSLRYFNIPDHDILLRIQEEYNLSTEEAERCMKPRMEA